MRRALVTGGTKGIGLATARALAAAGHEIVALYAHDDDAARAAETALGGEGLSFRAHKADVASAADIDALFAVEGERGFDALVHAAGFTRDKLMLMMPERDFDDVVAAHLKGGYLVAKQALKAMISHRFGRVVNIVSPTALLGRAGQTNYGAAKAGLIGLTRSLAREVARFKITVNCVCAGFVETSMTAGLPEKARQEMLQAIPLGRPGRPEEIADAVAWLCSDGAGYITGTVLGVDGGLT
ncbi:MAG: 3-oxoacyl-[acyl-carrier-protein] reductase [Myxococcales bacterium]|nr:3-oxoacyl-[acyl-carrier-protein] reductase [Myxococcales bacterium]